MSVVVKSLIAVGSLGTLTGAGFAINHFVSGESIENFLKKSNDNKVFLTSDTDGLSDILDAYESSKREKPKNITKEGLVSWCKGVIKGKYYGNDDNNFKGASSWCFININSFAKQLKKNSNEKLSEKESTDKSWTDAWDSYVQGRKNSTLKIVYSTKQNDLDGNEKVKGAAALQEWCKSKLEVKLYLDDAEKEFEKFSHWCPKVSAG